MSFWNNPENNSTKVLLLVLLVAIAGYFVYKNMQTGGGGEGRVININTPGTVINVTPPGGIGMYDCNHANTFQTVSGDCVYIDNSKGLCEVKDVHKGSCTTNETVPASVRLEGTTGTTKDTPTSDNVSCREEYKRSIKGDCYFVSPKNNCVPVASNGCAAPTEPVIITS